MIQRAALGPDALRRANSRAFELERLTRSSLLAERPGSHWRVLQAELVDLENLDIPYFEYRLGSTRVESAAGPIEGLLTGDGIEEAVARVRDLCEADLEWQRRIIRGSVRARYQRISAVSDPLAPTTGSEADRQHGANRPRPDAAEPQTLHEAADEIVAELHRSSIDDRRGNRTWLTLSLIPDADRVQLGLIGDGLYDGRAGVAAFEMLMAQAADDGRTDFEATLAPTMRRLRAADDYTRFRYIRDLGLGWSGVGGLLRLFDLQRNVGEASGADTGPDSTLSNVTAELVAREPFRDLLAGVAGLVGPLARRHRESPTDFTGILLSTAADHLLRSQDESGGWAGSQATAPLTGLSHGAAGMGLALMEAGVVLGVSEYVAAAARAFDYERAHFDAASGNWPDFRENAVGADGQPGSMVAWCHGAAGIGLARMRALELLPDHPNADLWHEEFSVAMATTADYPLAPMDHLCCGNVGRAAVLRIAGRWDGRQDWLRAADDLTAQVLARAHDRGRYAVPLDDPETTGSTPPGLMTGLSGIGAHLITTAQDLDLRALLL